jgi:hypothetical protein
MLLHHGFFAGLQLEDAAKGINVFAGNGLKDDAVAFLHKVDAGARFDAEPAPDARGDDQLAFGCDVGGVHVVSVILKKDGINTNVRQVLFCKTYSQCLLSASLRWKNPRHPWFNGFSSLLYPVGRSNVFSDFHFLLGFAVRFIPDYLRLIL